MPSCASDLPTESIAHFSTADCCIHPPGRNEMIAVTPPKIFSKEVAQNRPPHFLARTSLTTRNRFTLNFRGWGLDDNLKLKSPPYRGSHYRGSAARQNEVGLAARAAASCRAPAPAPPSCIAIAMRSMQPLHPLRLCNSRSLVWRLDSPEMVGALTEDRDAPAFERGGGLPLGDGAG